MTVLAVAVSVLPVFLFLAALVLIDSYKLVALRAILLPVMPCPAIPHDHSEPIASRNVCVGGEQRPYWDLIAWMAPAGVCYLPATVIPVGCLSNGLPIGIQIVGPYLEDLTTLDLAKRLLALSGGCPRPPGFC